MKNNNKFLHGFLVELIIFILIILFLKIDNVFYNLSIILSFIIALFLINKNKELSSNITDSFSQFNREITIMGGVLVILLPIFFYNNDYIIHILIFAWIYVIAALGLNFQIGSIGMANFAQSTFLGLGAYSSAILCTRYGFSFWHGLVLSIIVTVFFGLILGYLCLNTKTKSFYLSLVTIAFCYITYLVVHNMQYTGGPNGISEIPKVSIFGIIFKNSLSYYYLVIAFVALSVFIAWRFYNSWLGLVWNAIREDEIASQCYGINITFNKLLAFVFGSIFAGIAGVLYAHFIGFISPEIMTFSVGLLFVSMVILGGLDNVFGVIVGAMLLIIVPEKFRVFKDFRIMSYGVVLILMILFRQRGLFPFKPRKYKISRRSNNE